MKVNTLEVGEDLSTMATFFWGEGLWMGRWIKEEQKLWRKQIFEVQTWRPVRELARAIMCETHDAGVRWPQWHTCLI